MNDMGEIHIKEFDAKCSKTPSRDFRLAKLNFNYADEHNAASICIMESGRIIVAYTGHACGGKLTYRITERPFDIFSFGAPQTIDFVEDVSYAQISENTERAKSSELIFDTAEKSVIITSSTESFSLTAAKFIFIL